MTKSAIDNVAVRSESRPTFGLLELAVGIVILGLVTALAIPRIGRGAEGEMGSDLRSKLHVLRIAIERYRQDHDAYPGIQGDGVNPAGSAAAVISQLTGYSDANGISSEERDARFRFGPYLKRGIPTCPVAGVPGDCRLVVVNSDEMPPSTAEGGWIYSTRNGTIRANSTERDGRGRSYASY